ncbi:putative hydroxymethylpyrimidine transporter CytX [Clostridiaceae bacterium 68-1-5]|uniref:Putative hydroxymethylpyrimidine transporter CytX n=1 Tax=Suipraeoptans intestinalis TaxID=2606628 RepID=A0A6N7V0T0_9FIRM|nr:putative hydroxymethylpyrimidine transporter CytX [Suipraeoptans intestinalis]MSR94205.1 putative hydroxymethylpyrimidine transporter CytX [Suipraeoptans intestinalis]
MEKRKTILLENGLIWFGAGISIAEIHTGTYFSGLGWQKGILAILLGHLIGCTLLFLAGVLGGRQGKSAMETVKGSFGEKGGVLFAVLNIVQLAGWTAIMIYDGAIAANEIWGLSLRIWCLIIGGLILLWICIGITHLGKLNRIAMTGLFFLTVLLSFVIFEGEAGQKAGKEVLSFGMAVELSVAMPLSWLPLISDYTREAREPVKASAVSAVVYGGISSWMYVIGMGMGMLTGESDIARIMWKAGLSAAGLFIIVFSTVTTTFLDAYSAGVSGESVFPGLRERYLAMAVTGVGVAGAMFFPLSNMTGFLYLIGSVFSPMIAIQITDVFFLKKESTKKAVDKRNLLLWGAGFVIYRFLMKMDFVLGSTVLAMLLTGLLCVGADWFCRRKADTARA